MSWKTTCVVVLGASGLLFASEARAEDPPAAGTAGGTATTTATASAGTGAPAAPAKKEESGETDHDTVVGHVGVGFFGLRQLPFAGGAPGALRPTTLDAPVIGARYWIQRNFGIDVGLGFASISGSNENVAGTTTTSTDHASQLGFALHVGVPIAFAHGKHYTFLLVPETDLGFTSGTQKGTAPAPDTNYSGFLFDIGARIGAEIHFGFIGVPQLALEGGIGLYFRRTSTKVKTDPNSTSDGTNSFGTAVPLTNPWGLFLNQVSAIYYF